MTIKISGLTLLSVSEVAYIINVTEVSVRNYIKHGSLRAQKITGRWLISENDFIDFIQRMEKAAA